MKDCTNCINAAWDKREGGALHPSGDGHCTWQLKLPSLPGAMHWMTTPVMQGGAINRRTPLKEHCPHWARKT